jgi:hypothetical protein
MLAVSDDIRVAMDLYRDSNSTVLSLWTIYTGAALALLGYLIGSKDPISVRAKLALALVFGIFATTNALSLWGAQSTAYSAWQAIDAMRAAKDGGVPASLQEPLSTLKMYRPFLAVAFQAVLSMFALVAIFRSHTLHDAYANKTAKKGA